MSWQCVQSFKHLGEVVISGLGQVCTSEGGACREQLRFPSGTATAQIIRTLFGIDPSKPSEEVATERTGVTSAAAPTVHTLLDAHQVILRLPSYFRLT